MPCDKPTSVVLDYDVLKAMLGTGLPVYERSDSKSKPRVKVGDIFPVRETYRYIGYNRIQFKLDADENDETNWRYAKNMPLCYARFHVKVLAVSLMDKAEYMQRVSCEIAYNRKMYGMPLFHLPKDRWFRNAVPPQPFDEKQWVVEYELVETRTKKHADDSNIIDFYSAVSRV